MLSTLLLSSLAQAQQLEKFDGMQEGTLFQEVLEDSLVQLKAGKGNKYYSSPEYIALSAKDKQDQLWAEVVAQQGETGSFPSVLELPGIFVESMSPSFETPGDAMETGWFGTRRKYIHSVGSVAKVKFVPNAAAEKFTGIFKGGSYGLTRFSTAKDYAESSKLVPGFGLKFLRDGMDSANIVVMNDTEGQEGEWNIFSHPFSSVIPLPHSSDLKLLGKKFATFTPWVQAVSLKDYASADESGVEVAEPNYPYALSFKPAGDVKDLFPNTLDFSVDELPSILDQLESISADATLYEVYAVNQPEEWAKDMSGQEELIGQLVLDGQFTRSKWGDENLYFRHEDWRHTLEDHPEWTDALTPTKCPFGFD